MKKIELLCPAGSLEKLKFAFKYGADSVYLGGKNFSLRAGASNFENEEIKEAVKIAHNLGKKIYVTLNIFARNNHFEEAREYISFLNMVGVDAVIVSDIGMIAFVKEIAPNLTIHVSTQANVLNNYAIEQYAKLGAKCIVLARELSINEIAQMSKFIKDKRLDIELECFAHGAMCISYSGRCLLSKYTSNRDANEGNCIQACRWEYLFEGGLRAEQDEKGTYILNSKDLCLIEHIKELIDAGIVRFKIEGRMKTAYYVAAVTRAYKDAIDNLTRLNKKKVAELKDDLAKVSNREYTTGFVFNDVLEGKSQNTFESTPVVTYDFVGVALSSSKGYCIVEQRNMFSVGDRLEVLSSGKNHNKSFVVDTIIDDKGEKVSQARNVQAIYKIKCPYNLGGLDILRRKR